MPSFFDRLGLLSLLFLTLAASGACVLLFHFSGLAARAHGRLPALEDPRPLFISVLLFLLLGLTPLLLRLLRDDRPVKESIR